MERNGHIMLFNTTGVVTENALLGSDDEITTESSQLILEAAIQEFATPDELKEILESHSTVNDLLEMDAVSEKTLVRLDKNARISQTQKMAMFTIARERNDPDFKKLLTVWRMERNLETKLHRKYGNEAMRRAKVIVQKNYKQRGNAFVKITDKATQKINKATIPAPPKPTGRR